MKRSEEETIPFRVRTGVWGSILRRRDFFVSDLVWDTGLDENDVRSYLWSLVRYGYVEAGKYFPTPHGGKIRRLHVIQTQSNPPDIPRDLLYPGLRDGDSIWNLIRIKGLFTVADLVALSGLDEDPLSFAQTRAYLECLERAEYIVTRWESGDNRVFVIGEERTGPEAPVIRYTYQVYDPNIDKVVWPDGTGNADDETDALNF